ncbi:MAG: FAD-binding oxidoreductase [Rhodoferax sp.]
MPTAPAQSAGHAPATARPHALLDPLRALVGAAHVLTADSADLTAYEQDWRQRARGRALAVVLPASTEEVAAVVRACAAAGVAVVPQGGNTGMVVGATPDASGTQVVLRTTRMAAVRAIDPGNLTVTVEAGCVLQTLQEACAAQGYLFPLSLGSEGSCTIGGNLSTNAGGTQVVRYGNARELCLGLEVVTPQGEVWSNLTGLRKDNTGYDLRHLLIGAEGTLGIITAATLRISPLPAVQLTAFVAVPSLEAAVQLLTLAHRHLHAGLSGFEVMGRFALGLVAKHFPQQRIPLVDTLDDTTAPYCVVLENSDLESSEHARGRFEALLEEALDQGHALDAVVAESVAQARALWHIRESIPLAQAQEGLNLKHDISLPISTIPTFVAQAHQALQSAHPGVRLVNYGHLGDGNLHFNVQAPEGADAEGFLREQEAPIATLVYGLVRAHGGSISAEHGIGSLKRDTLVEYKNPTMLATMRAIKAALDPQGIMNPGKMV